MSQKKASGPLSSKLPSQYTIEKHFNIHDKAMARIIKKVGPIKLKPDKKYFFVLCRSIISQQISVKAANAILTRFLKLFPGQSPIPQLIHEISEFKIRKVGISKQKVAYMKSLSEKFIDKSINPRKFKFMENEEIIESLTKIYGIGRWTAEMFLIFSLGRMNVLPSGDLGIRVAVKNIYELETMPTPKDLNFYGKKWAPYETVGSWYAWRSLNLKVATN